MNMSRSINRLSNILHNYASSSSIFTRFLSYKSSLSLERIYPTSTLKLTTPSFTPSDPNEKFSGYIPIEKLDIKYSRSSGPGGQNVNKVNTKVDLRFKIAEAYWIESSIREKIMQEHRTKISKDGYFVLKSDLTRYQHLNLAHCLKKLREIIRQAAEPAPVMSEETEEMIRKRKLRSARERLMVKRNDSMKRTLRQAPTVHDL